MSRRPDEWLLPQQDLPARPKLSGRRLYRRRERVFLTLAALFLVGTALMPLLGAGKVFGASRLAREAGVPLAMQLLLPIGAVALPLALLALALACELFERKRARALLLVGFIVWLGALGLSWVTDTLPDFDGGVTRAFGPSAAFVVCTLVTCWLQLEVFAGLGRATRGRQLWLRAVLSSTLGLVVGWGCFALVVSYLPRAALPPLDGFTAGEQLASIAMAGGGYSVLAVIAGSIPLAIAARPLATHLRIERHPPAPELDDYEERVPRREPAFAAPRRKQPAQVVETSPVVARAARSGVSNSRPFTSDEVAFFDAGEELANKPASDSFSDLERRDSDR